MTRDKYRPGRFHFKDRSHWGPDYEGQQCVYVRTGPSAGDDRRVASIQPGGFKEIPGTDPPERWWYHKSEVPPGTPIDSLVSFNPRDPELRERDHRFPTVEEAKDYAVYVLSGGPVEMVTVRATVDDDDLEYIEQSCCVEEVTA